MKFKNPLLVVTDMERSKAFYREVLGLRVIMDFGANVTLTAQEIAERMNVPIKFVNHCIRAGEKHGVK